LLFFEKLQTFLMDKYHYKFFNPQTIFSIAYNRDQPVDFTRTSTTFDLEYRWFHTPTGRELSSFTPLNFSLINSRFDETNLIQNVLGLREGVTPTPAQLQTIVFILRDLNPRFNSIIGYNRTHSFKYGQSRKNNSWYFRWGADLGGLLPLVVEQVVHRLGSSDTSLTDDIIQFSASADTKDRQAYNYGKFLRFTAEWKYFVPFSEKTELVFRAYAGWAPPLFNSRIIPFEYRFYSGGTNSIRGWQSGTLGPGKANPDLNRIFPTGGDYKIELNAEYRRDFIKPLELAFFIDAGNVWATGRDTLADSDQKLSINNLRLGLAAGVGLRFDFSFLVIRLDIGQQIYSPFLDEWLFFNPQRLVFGERYIQYNLGIGYPF